jgi:hypothetical protein
VFVKILESQDRIVSYWCRMVIKKSNKTVLIFSLGVFVDKLHQNIYAYRLLRQE